MSQWYHNNRRLFRDERGALAEACPLMMLSVVGPGFHLNSVSITRTACAVAHGTYSLSAPGVSEELEYKITLWLPPNYPRSHPIMFCNDPKLPINNIDRHILYDGQACLEVRNEIKRRWPPGSNIFDFLCNLVSPFLAWQTYYDVFDMAPEWGERAHGKKGIIQYYADLLGRPADETIIIRFMKLLSRKSLPKGHEICPCGSGVKLRNCHHRRLIETYSQVDPEAVSKDLMLILEQGKAAKGHPY